MDLKRWASDLGLDEDDVPELLELYVSTAVSDIRLLKEARRQNDSALAAAAAHSLKGSAGNLGFMVISEMAAQTEKKAYQNCLDGLNETIAVLKEHVTYLNTIL